MHAIVPNIVPATAPPQVAASADMVEPALSIFGGDQRRKSQVKIHLFGLFVVDARDRVKENRKKTSIKRSEMHKHIACNAKKTEKNHAHSERERVWKGKLHVYSNINVNATMRKQCRNLTQNWYSPSFFFRVKLLSLHSNSLSFFSFFWCCSLCGLCSLSLPFCQSHAIKRTCSPGFVLCFCCIFLFVCVRLRCFYSFLSLSSDHNANRFRDSSAMCVLISLIVVCIFSFHSFHPLGQNFSLTHSLTLLERNSACSPFAKISFVCVFSLLSTEYRVTCFFLKNFNVFQCWNVLIFAHTLSNLKRDTKMCWKKKKYKSNDEDNSWRWFFSSSLFYKNKCVHCKQFIRHREEKVPWRYINKFSDTVWLVQRR